MVPVWLQTAIMLLQVRLVSGHLSIHALVVLRGGRQLGTCDKIGVPVALLASRRKMCLCARFCEFLSATGVCRRMFLGRRFNHTVQVNRTQCTQYEHAKIQCRGTSHHQHTNATQCDATLLGSFRISMIIFLCVFLVLLVLILCFRIFSTSARLGKPSPPIDRTTVWPTPIWCERCKETCAWKIGHG